MLLFPSIGFSTKKSPGHHRHEEHVARGGGASEARGASIIKGGAWTVDITRSYRVVTFGRSRLEVLVLQRWLGISGLVKL